MLQIVSNLLSRFKLAQLMLILASLVITTMLVSTYLSISSVRTGVLAVEHQSLSMHLSSLAKIVANIKNEDSGAKLEQLKATIYPARWGANDSGYAFLIDGKSAKYIVYPPAPEKEGGNMSSIQIDEGGYLADAIKRSSQRGIAEMVHYPHTKPGSDTATLKAAYLYPLEQGGDVLVAGTYLDRSDAILANIYEQISIPMIVIIIFVLVFISFVTKHLSYRANYLQNAMQLLAQGDLRHPVHLSGRDEMAFLASSLNISQQSLSRVLKQQTANGSTIASASVQIDTSLVHTNELIHSELDSLNHLASAMEEMVCSVAEVAENASNASDNAQSTDKRTHQGEKQIKESINAIEELCENLTVCAQSVTEVKDGVTSIDTVVDTIHSISEQTNLLALNAAIEAARAGEQGRGFAVVADEVRQLASRTQQATQQITDMIAALNQQAISAVGLVDQSVSSAETGMAAAKQAGREFVAITDDVAHLNDSNLQIATAAEQQRNVAETMSENINQLNTELTETSQDLGELADASNSLKTQTDLLDEQLKAFIFEQHEQGTTNKANLEIDSAILRGASI